jgi:hypothetical protein
MKLAIGHRENGVIILDALRESKPLFSPAQVVMCGRKSKDKIAELANIEACRLKRPELP